MSQRWPNLQNLVDCDGEITVSYRASVGRVAAATQERQIYALLRVADSIAIGAPERRRMAPTSERRYDVPALQKPFRFVRTPCSCSNWRG